MNGSRDVRSFRLLLVGVGSAAAVCPAFLKLHKVGSTTVAMFLECWSARHRAEVGVCADCVKRNGVQLEGMSGPWSHSAARAFSETESTVFDRCGCGPVLAIVREPVDHFLSMAGFFLRPPYINRDAYQFVLKFLQSPTDATPSQAQELLDLFERRFPAIENGQRNPVRIDELSSTFPGGFDDVVIGLSSNLTLSIALFTAAIQQNSANISHHDLCLPATHLRKNDRRSPVQDFPQPVTDLIAKRLKPDLLAYQSAVQRYHTLLSQFRPHVDRLLRAADDRHATCLQRRQRAFHDHPDLLHRLTSSPYIKSTDIRRACALLQGVGPSTHHPRSPL